MIMKDRILSLLIQWYSWIKFNNWNILNRLGKIYYCVGMTISIILILIMFIILLII